LFEISFKGVGTMLARAWAVARETEKPGARDAEPNLTTEQKEATIQKWADWILKQREAARIARGETDNPRPPA